jgi:hypothetical protein
MESTDEKMHDDIGKVYGGIRCDKREDPLHRIPCCMYVSFSWSTSKPLLMLIDIFPFSGTYLSTDVQENATV